MLRLFEPPEAPPATIRYDAGVDDTTVPNVILHEFVSVFNNCTETPGKTLGTVAALVLPFSKTEIPEMPRTIAVVPLFAIVISVPIGNATEEFNGIVIVCAPVFAE
jgi:hypothetical protein